MSNESSSLRRIDGLGIPYGATLALGMNESQAVLVPLVQFQVYCNGTSQWFASEAKRLNVCGSFNPLEGETVPLIRHGDTVGVSVGVCVAVGVSVGIAVGVGVKVGRGVKVPIGLAVLVALAVLVGLAAACTPKGPPPR